MACADDGGEVERGLGGDFAADDDDIALGVTLAGDAAGLVLGQAGVQDRVGDGVADFVRVAFADGLGGEDESFAHVLFVLRSRCC